MTHEVHYLDWFWHQNREIGEWVPRMERNLDQTNTSGLHLGFTQPLTRSGWCFGAATTLNRKSASQDPELRDPEHPPDPGDSWAYDFGVGIAKTGERATYGIDLVLEPISSLHLGRRRERHGRIHRQSGPSGREDGRERVLLLERENPDGHWTRLRLGRVPARSAAALHTVRPDPNQPHRRLDTEPEGELDGVDPELGTPLRHGRVRSALQGTADHGNGPAGSGKDRRGGARLRLCGGRLPPRARRSIDVTRCLGNDPPNLGVDADPVGRFGTHPVDQTLTKQACDAILRACC